MSDGQGYNPQKIIKQILISVFISLGTIIAIFLILSFRGVSIDFSQFQPIWLVGGFFSIIAAWFIDAFRLYFTTRAWEKPISYRNSLTGVLSCYFMSSITPSLTGGSPAEMLILNRSGMTWGEAGCLTTICGILYQVTLLILLLILVLVLGVHFALRGILLHLFYSFLIFYSTLIFLLFFFLNRMDLVYRFVHWGMRFSNRHFPKLKFSDKSVLNWVNDFFADFKNGFRLLFINKPQYLLLNIIGYSLYFICFFSVAFFVLLSLGVYVPLKNVLVDQIPLYLIFGFLPTPGASGGVELSIGSVFLSSTGPEKISLFILFWRFITFFLTMIVGAITFFRVLFAIGKKMTQIVPSNKAAISNDTPYLSNSE
ncbi:MAG: flippase-like domain-containing protein [Candidatus Atribacteria bacterium]|nr:flippase-like domain-containing protein [Candidatus Atribacteria bacterium]